MFDINGWEFLLLLVIGIVVLGPERLPEYAAKLGRFVRQARTMAERAQDQLKSEMGDDFKDIDWKVYDPRQYDPRRIVRDALTDAPEPEPEPAPDEYKAHSGAKSYDPAKPTPWDLDAT